MSQVSCPALGMNLGSCLKEVFIEKYKQNEIKLRNTSKYWRQEWLENLSVKFIFFKQYFDISTFKFMLQGNWNYHDLIKESLRFLTFLEKIRPGGM